MELLSSSQAAKRIDVNEDTIRRWVHNGVLKIHQKTPSAWLYLAEDVDRAAIQMGRQVLQVLQETVAK